MNDTTLLKVKKGIHHIETTKAKVKMTVGIPVNSSLESDSDSSDESKLPKLRSLDAPNNFVSGSNINVSSVHKAESLSANVKREAAEEIKSSDFHGYPHYSSSSSSEHNNISSAKDIPIVVQRKKMFKRVQGVPRIVKSDSDVRGEYRNSRFNPFNHDLLLEEDHFSDSNLVPHQRHSVDCGYNSISYSSHSFQDPFKDEAIFTELGLSEDHFSHPQGLFGHSGAEELEIAIENCKEMIKNAVQNSERQKNLVVKLVQLRVKLQEIKEGPEVVEEGIKVILSHKMQLKSNKTSKYYCERCNASIWGMLQAWYRCTECGYRCHEKCLQQILRTCAKAKVLENPSLIMDICPKDPSGLSNQTFRCTECRSVMSFSGSVGQPRLCDYTGKYYCAFCHWNDTLVIPARVLHNWDFTPRKVCRATKQFLKLMKRKAVIRISDVNPVLFVYVDQLNEIKKLREEMMIMKKYVLSCPKAMEEKLLLLLERRQHFVECSDRYSMQDLIDAEDDVLLPEVVNVHSAWAQHIKVDCQLCQGRGFFCELCDDKDVLFPFDNIAVVCAKCSSVLHRHCYAKKCICPRCARREKRKEYDES